MHPELRPYQLDLYHRVRAQRAAGKRIIIVQGTTGCGKNTWAAYVAWKACQMEKRVLMMAHRRKLVEQIAERLDQFWVNYSVLMRGQAYDRTAPVCVASRDTLASRAVRHEWLDMPMADVVILDECHHAADPESEYRRILTRYPDATILLLSATPVDSEGNGMGPWAEAIECAAPTSQLVKDGYLCPTKVFSPDRKTRGNKYVKGVAGELVASWKEFGQGRPTVAFFSRVQHSKDAVEAYQANGITAAHVDAETPDYERDRIFEQIASGETKILCNVGIVGEGVDMPELSCCQLFCNCEGRIAFLQRCGRVMRPAPGKDHGIVIDHSGAVFQHGFPDEDTEWPLNGNADVAFKKKHDEGETEKAFYCKQCQLTYHGQETCPQCGRLPVKPPRSIFAPPPQATTDELLVEAERAKGEGVYSRIEKEKHWLRCLGVAANKPNGSMGMAAQMYFRKYGEWPADDFPHRRHHHKAKVAEVCPQFRRRQRS